MISPDAPKMIDRLARFVAINTENPPGQEAAGAHFLAAELRGLGFEVETREELPGRANVIARLDNGPGPCFAFNSHIDVVPAGGGWTHPAFSLKEKNDRLYGRGACDAKGPIVAMIEAARMLSNLRKSWSGQLLLVFVFDEEVQSLGAKEYAKQGAKIDYVIIGEPTSNVVATAHKGSIRPIIRVHGMAAHSGTPHFGINAIVKAAELIRLFDEHHRNHLCHQHHPLVGSPSLTVTRAQAGTGDTVVPESCDLMVDRRLVPGDDRDVAIKELEDILAVAAERFGVRAEIIEFRPTTGPATETPLDHPIVKVTESIASAFNANAKPVGFPAGCDLVHFRSLGAAGVVLGPGDLGVAHKPDEFVPIKEFIDASMIYRDTVLKMLFSAGGPN
jgi:acetylornithine deacetylase/succinyl-diaminopimelate desuccinylase family protein